MLEERRIIGHFAYNIYEIIFENSLMLIALK